MPLALTKLILVPVMVLASLATMPLIPQEPQVLVTQEVQQGDDKQIVGIVGDMGFDAVIEKAFTPSPRLKKLTITSKKGERSVTAEYYPDRPPTGAKKALTALDTVRKFLQKKGVH